MLVLKSYFIMLVCCVALAATAGCEEGTSVPQFPDRGVDAFQVRDLVFPDTYVPPRLDTIAPRLDSFVDPCAIFSQEGQSCNGGQACPSGQQPFLETSGACTCRIACNPTQPNQCAGTACNRLCVQLYDGQGKPIAGIGACLADEGKTEGESCAPDQCRQKLVCVGDNDKVSFCRQKCTGPADCFGFKNVCIQLTGTTTKVCIPGGSTTGPGEGGSCAGPNDYCKQGLICDPGAKVCRKACNTDDGGTPCSGGKKCDRLLDSAASVVVGYGCK
jgi:hypothetical protein